jgi:site-specific recombinase XerD
MKFMDWSEERALELTGITPFVVRAYVKQMQREYAPATVRQHLVAIRLLFDHLVLAGALPLNPAASVRASPNMVKPQEGGATVLQPDEAGRLLASIDVSDRSGVRDRALLGLMLATRVRVSAITTAHGSGSKANLLRGFWKQETNRTGRGGGAALPISSCSISGEERPDQKSPC